VDQKCLLNAKTASDVIDALSHPTRLLIVCMLLDREHFVQEMFDELGTTKGNISNTYASWSKRDISPAAKRRIASITASPTSAFARW
jgi:DNA-binding transcriptional ArsR family regulator